MAKLLSQRSQIALKHPVTVLPFSIHFMRRALLSSFPPPSSSSSFPFFLPPQLRFVALVSNKTKNARHLSFSGELGEAPAPAEQHVILLEIMGRENESQLEGEGEEREDRGGRGEFPFRRRKKAMHEPLNVFVCDAAPTTPLYLIKRTKRSAEILYKEPFSALLDFRLPGFTFSSAVDPGKGN